MKWRNINIIKMKLDIYIYIYIYCLLSHKSLSLVYINVWFRQIDICYFIILHVTSLYKKSKY